jgi:hypothetical protein
MNLEENVLICHAKLKPNIKNERENLEKKLLQKKFTERKLWYPQLRIPGLHSYKSNSLYVIAGHND